MWDREMKRWDAERALWTVREERLQQQIANLQALVVSNMRTILLVSLCAPRRLMCSGRASICICTQAHNPGRSQGSLWAWLSRLHASTT